MPLSKSGRRNVELSIFACSLGREIHLPLAMSDFNPTCFITHADIDQRVSVEAFQLLIPLKRRSSHQIIHEFLGYLDGEVKAVGPLSEEAVLDTKLEQENLEAKRI